MIPSTGGSNPPRSGDEPDAGTNTNIKLNMEVKFKRLSDKAILPIRAHEGDAGVDLTATNITTSINEAGQLMMVYHTDLAVEIPEGYVGLLFPRSSIWKKSITFTNCVGVIDSGYRGELMIVAKATTDVVPRIYNIGERFAQLVIVPCPTYTIVEAADLEDSERGEDGFGSTGDTSATEAAEDTQVVEDNLQDMSVIPQAELAAGNEEHSETDALPEAA